MRLFAASAAATAALLSSVSAQTYTTCNPLDGSCPAVKGLGGSISVDFTSGASSQFTVVGDTVSYGPDGAEFTISQSGNSPQINSNWYIMFGSVTVVAKAAPGTGIVSSSVLQSDDLDEFDWEWLGYQSGDVQTNYFGKGITGDYDRGTTVPIATTQSEFNSYTIDWTAEQTTWSINGQVVRTLTPATAETNQYPQTPMQVKIGSWSAGDPRNAPGTIAWAGGNTNYAAGPFTMVVQSVAVTDYSTGKEYSYQGTSGNWQSIVAIGGQVNSGGSASTSGSSGSSGSSSSTTVIEGPPSSTVTSIPGLPSGWTVSSSGRVVPPSSANTLPQSYTASPLPPALASSTMSYAVSTTGGSTPVSTYPTTYVPGSTAPRNTIGGFVAAAAAALMWAAALL